MSAYASQVCFAWSSCRERVGELIREICRANDVEILKGHISKGHVHIFVSVPPYLSISKLVRSLKGKTSRKMLTEFKELSKKFWGRHMWAAGYFAASSGDVTDEVIMQYSESQDIEQKDDDFRITE